jgi:Fe-S oxidoreductase
MPLQSRYLGRASYRARARSPCAGPAARGTQGPDREIVMADGISCRTQIEQTTGRRALHLAEVLEMALRDGTK